MIENFKLKDVNYFIDKFSNIPENDWCTRNFQNSQGQKCALGHCGGYASYEGRELSSIFRYLSLPSDNFYPSVANINDGENEKYQQKTPKQRILAALDDVREIILEKEAAIEAQKIIDNPLGENTYYMDEKYLVI